MAKLGILGNSDLHSATLTEYLTQEQIQYTLGKKQAELTDVDGIIIPISKRNQVVGSLKWISSFKEQSSSFIWVFSEESLEFEQEILIAMGVNDVITTKERLPYLTTIVKNTFNRLDRRNQSKPEKNSQIKINQKTRFLLFENEKIKLTKRECILFTYLLKYENQVVSYEDIENHLWNEDKKDSHTHIANIVYRLREKIKLIDCYEIENISSVGYQLKKFS